MRKPLIAGNWKMNLGPPAAADLIHELHLRSEGWPDVDVLVCPPFVSIPSVAEALVGLTIMLGAQNMHEKDSGAFTGEISGEMLLTLGCTHVILGHSERRQMFGETDDGVNAKTKAALGHGLIPIVCVGETLEEREAGKTEETVFAQLQGCFAGLTEEKMKLVIIAYEPVWAIGTGEVATVEQAGEMHAGIRKWLAKTYDQATADTIRILYGGSMKPDNAAGLLAHEDIDGGLVGGASLKADAFDGIIRAAG